MMQSERGMQAGLTHATPSVTGFLAPLLCELLAALGVIMVLEVVFVFGMMYPLSISQLCSVEEVAVSSSAGAKHVRPA